LDRLKLTEYSDDCKLSDYILTSTENLICKFSLFSQFHNSKMIHVKKEIQNYEANFLSFIYLKKYLFFTFN